MSCCCPFPALASLVHLRVLLLHLRLPSEMHYSQHLKGLQTVLLDRFIHPEGAGAVHRLHIGHRAGPLHCLEQLGSEWLRLPNCIVKQLLEQLEVDHMGDMAGVGGLQNKMDAV